MILSSGILLIYAAAIILKITSIVVLPEVHQHLQGTGWMMRRRRFLLFLLHRYVLMMRRT